MHAPSDNDPRGRAIRSYVLRAGRLTRAQQRALDTCWPHYGVPFTSQRLDLDQVFARHAPRTLEIGFGNGENLLTRATQQPERDFLGVEVHRPGVGHLLLGLEAAQLSNVRLIAHDVVEVLEQQLAVESLDEVQLLFPDPWPKKRHHKRRLVQSVFLALLASRLRAGGHLHIATDWEPYAQAMLADLHACTSLTPTVSESVDVHAGARARTRFQRRGEQLGHRIYELHYARVGG